MTDITERPISIVIIDPYVLLRAGLRLIIECQGGLMVAGEASNSRDGLEMVACKHPDIILLELNPDGDPGMELIPGLLKAWNHGRIILLANLDEAQMCVKAVQEGVLGVIFKTQPPEVLIKAIRKVQAGEIWIERSMVADLLTSLSRAKMGLASDPEAQRISQLSDRERQVIQLIGRGLKNKQIAERLCISETTVRHHLTSVYDKLGVTDRLELLVYANRNSLA